MENYTAYTILRDYGKVLVLELGAIIAIDEICESFAVKISGES